MSVVPIAAATSALKRKVYTLVLLAERSPPSAAATVGAPAAAAPLYSRLLLGMKKRGFGAGKWNGFGGKLEAGETPRAAAVREMREECGVEIAEEALSKRAILLQEFEPSEDATVPSMPVMEVHVYLAEKYSGTPVESEEMRPQWWDIPSLPYDSMWADDRHWYPTLLADAAPRFRAHFLFRGQETLLKHTLEHMSEQEQRDMELDDLVPRGVKA